MKALRLTLLRKFPEPEEEQVPEPTEEDKEMVNDITDLINGLSGIHSGDKPAKTAKAEQVEEKPKNLTEKDKFGKMFSNTWGGVIYDY